MAGFPLLRLSLALFGFTRLQAFLGRGQAPLEQTPTAIDQVHKIHLLVEGAARRSPGRVTCLPHSLMLWYILRRHSYPSQLRIGVQKPNPTDLTAHAWVEYNNIPLNASPHVHQKYTPFNQPITPHTTPHI